jgi:hypothetical protein
MTLFYSRLECGTAKEWREWRRQTRQRHPIQWFFRERFYSGIVRCWRQYVHEPWYWLKCRVWHRHNVIVCRSLPPTWNDRDQRMLHAAFQCLEDFVEYEKPWQFAVSSEEVAKTYDEVYDSYYGPVDTRRSDAWESLKELHAWWQTRKSDYSGHKDDDAMLHRLIELRGHLWT